MVVASGAAGSTQNTSMINLVLCSMMADGFKTMADRIEAGEQPAAVAQSLLKENFKAVFNGNGYAPDWPDKAQGMGIWRIDSGVDAINKLGDKKNLELFESLGVFSRVECTARRDILFEQYLGTVDMEVNCMMSMIKKNVIPACKKAGAQNHQPMRLFLCLAADLI